MSVWLCVLLWDDPRQSAIVSKTAISPGIGYSKNNPLSFVLSEELHVAVY